MIAYRYILNMCHLSGFKQFVEKYVPYTQDLKPAYLGMDTAFELPKTVTNPTKLKDPATGEIINIPAATTVSLHPAPTKEPKPHDIVNVVIGNAPDAKIKTMSDTAH